MAKETKEPTRRKLDFGDERARAMSGYHTAPPADFVEFHGGDEFHGRDDFHDDDDDDDDHDEDHDDYNDDRDYYED